MGFIGEVRLGIIMIFWGGEGSRRAGAGLRFAEEWAAEEILDQVGSRLAAGRGLLDIKICMPTRQGIVCGRLTALRSHRRVTACTARRRGVPFVRTKGTKIRLGLRPKTPTRRSPPPPGKPKQRLPGAGLDDAYKAPQAHFM